jgi:dihydroorotate dehydrogenase
MLSLVLLMTKCTFDAKFTINFSSPETTGVGISLGTPMLTITKRFVGQSGG